MPSGSTHPSLSQGLGFDFQGESISPVKVGFVPLKPALFRLLCWCEEEAEGSVGIMAPGAGGWGGRGVGGEAKCFMHLAGPASSSPP